MEKVDLQTAKNIYFSHVQNVIFEEHEIRIVQGILADYKTIVGNYGFSTGCIRSSSIKELLMDEFGERIGFHTRAQRNLSELVYEKSGGGSYIEAALMSIGISDEQVVRNAANRLKQQVDLTPTVPWPVHVAELEEEEEVSNLLLKLITWIKKSRKFQGGQ